MDEFEKKINQELVEEYADYYINCERFRRILKVRQDTNSSLPPQVYDTLDEELMKIYKVSIEKFRSLKSEIEHLSGSISERTDGAYKISSDLIKLLSFIDTNLLIIDHVLEELKDLLDLPLLKSNYLDIRLRREKSTLQRLINQSIPVNIINKLRDFLGGVSEIDGLLLEESIKFKLGILKNHVSKTENYHYSIIAENPILSYQVTEKEEDSPDLPTLIFVGLSYFFFLLNFYWLMVFSKDYSQEFNQSSNFAGYLSGITWFSSLICAYPLSIISLHNFKVPTIACAVLAAVGNFLYFSAKNSMILLVISRIIFGMGSSLVIGRRYLLVYVPMRMRNIWLTIYATVGVLGIGFGFLIASFVPDFQFSFLGIGISRENFGSFVMFFVWTAYIAVVFKWFKEPNLLKVIPNIASSPGEPTETLPLLYSFTVIWCLFFSKCIFESFLVSATIIYPELWGWELTYIALYLAITSICSCPVLLVIRNQFGTYQHSRIIVIGMFFCLIGAVLLINFGEMMQWEFFAGSLILYASTTTIGGVSDVLNSKILPLKLSRGMLNSALIATLAGAIGRSIGAFSVGWIGDTSARTAQDRLFIPLGGITFITFIISVIAWKSGRRWNRQYSGMSN